jgi:hypothetical protein
MNLLDHLDVYLMWASSLLKIRKKHLWYIRNTFLSFLVGMYFHMKLKRTKCKELKLKVCSHCLLLIWIRSHKNWQGSTWNAFKKSSKRTTLNSITKSYWSRKVKSIKKRRTKWLRARRSNVLRDAHSNQKSILMKKQGIW